MQKFAVANPQRVIEMLDLVYRRENGEDPDVKDDESREQKAYQSHHG